MSLRTKCSLVFLAFAFILGYDAKAQVTVSNPGEYAAITKGEMELNSAIGAQSGLRTSTTTELGAMYLATDQMHKWQKNYINYLEKGYGFAQQVLAVSDVFSSAVETFMALREIQKAMSVNPQGPFATLGMNNLYVQIGVEFLECYKLVNLVKTRASDNLLKGSERAKLIWAVSDKIRSLNNKLHRLAISICCYSFEDVWNRATFGLIQKTHDQLAKEAKRRFERAIKNTTKLYMKK